MPTIERNVRLDPDTSFTLCMFDTINRAGERVPCDRPAVIEAHIFDGNEPDPEMLCGHHGSIVTAAHRMRYAGSVNARFVGTDEQRRENRATHNFVIVGDPDDGEVRCTGCDCRPSGLADWPCYPGKSQRVEVWTTR